MTLNVIGIGDFNFAHCAFRKFANCCFFFKNYLFIMAVLYLCCCAGFSLDVASGGYSLGVAPGLFITVASPAAEHRL